MDDNRRFCTDCAAPLEKEMDRGLKTRRIKEEVPRLEGGKGPEQEIKWGEPAEELAYESHEEEPLTVKADPTDEGAKAKNTVVVRSRRALRGRSAVVTTGGFVGIFMLMLVPLVNLMALIIWALGGCKKIMKQNFARAALLMLLIGLVLAGVNHIYGDIIAEAIGGFLQSFGIGASLSGFYNLLGTMQEGLRESGELMLEGINRLLALLGVDVIS
jgi:hypothetical protein